VAQEVEFVEVVENQNQKQEQEWCKQVGKLEEMSLVEKKIQQ
jgi:hypothetical protein